MTQPDHLLATQIVHGVHTDGQAPVPRFDMLGPDTDGPALNAVWNCLSINRSLQGGSIFYLIDSEQVQGGEPINRAVKVVSGFSYRS